MTVFDFGRWDAYAYPGGYQVTPVGLPGLTPTGNMARPVGGSATLISKVTNSLGQALSGVRVDFSVPGPNATSGFAYSDDAGFAPFTYDGRVANTDTATAQISVNGQSVSKTSQVSWAAAAPTIEIDSPADDSALVAGIAVLVSGVAKPHPSMPEARITHVTVNGVPVHRRRFACEDEQAAVRRAPSVTRHAAGAMAAVRTGVIVVCHIRRE